MNGVELELFIEKPENKIFNLQKSRVKEFTRTRRGKFERVGGHERRQVKFGGSKSEEDRAKNEVLTKLAGKVRGGAFDKYNKNPNEKMQHAAYEFYGIMLSLKEAGDYLAKVPEYSVIETINKQKVKKERVSPYKKVDGGSWTDAAIKKWAKDAAIDLKSDFGQD
jgi:hypothetical protein